MIMSGVMFFQQCVDVSWNKILLKWNVYQRILKKSAKDFLLALRLTTKKKLLHILIYISSVYIPFVDILFVYFCEMFLKFHFIKKIIKIKHNHDLWNLDSSVFIETDDAWELLKYSLMQLFLEKLYCYSCFAVGWILTNPSLVQVFLSKMKYPRSPPKCRWSSSMCCHQKN